MMGDFVYACAYRNRAHTLYLNKSLWRLFRLLLFWYCNSRLLSTFFYNKRVGKGNCRKIKLHQTCSSPPERRKILNVYAKSVDHRKNVNNWVKTTIDSMKCESNLIATFVHYCSSTRRCLSYHGQAGSPPYLHGLFAQCYQVMYARCSFFYRCTRFKQNLNIYSKIKPVEIIVVIRNK